MTFLPINYREAENSHLTGIPFFLISANSITDLDLIKQALDRQEEVLSVNVFDKYENNELYVPEIFGSDGRIALKNKIETVESVDGTIFATVTSDYDQRMYYRGKLYVIIRTHSYHFQIIYDEKIDRCFLILYCARYKSRALRNVLSKIFLDLGIRIVPAKLHPSKFEAISKKLDAEILIAQIEDFPELDLDKIIIIGDDIKSNIRFVEAEKIGSMKGQMLRYSFNEADLVFTLSNDGLVRFYNKLSYANFIYFMRSNILANLELSERMVIPLNGFFVDSIAESKQNSNKS